MPDGVVAIGLELVSVACLVHLWRRAPGGVLHKVVWSVLVLVPVLGPLFYGGLYSVPEPHAESPSPFETDPSDVADLLARDD